MKSLIELLESRTLLSAAPVAVTTLFAQARVVNADASASVKVDAAGLKVIGAELKAAKLLKTDKVAIATLTKGDAAGFKVAGKAIAAFEKIISNDTKKLEAVGNALAKKPTNAKLIAAVSAAKTTLSTQSSNALTSLTNDIGTLQTTEDTNSTALATANPTLTVLGTDVGNYQMSLGTALQTLQGAVSLALTTDVTGVLGLYP